MFVQIAGSNLFSFLVTGIEQCVSSRVVVLRILFETVNAYSTAPSPDVF
jgi:hypothetical protein